MQKVYTWQMQGHMLPLARSYQNKSMRQISEKWRVRVWRKVQFQSRFKDMQKI